MRLPTGQTATLNQNRPQQPNQPNINAKHQTNQPTSSFITNVNLPPPPQQNSQNQVTFNVSNNPILRLNQTITNLNLPAEPVLDNSHMSLR